MEDRDDEMNCKSTHMHSKHAHKRRQKHVSNLHWHGPQVRTEEEEPHELVGIYGNQVTNLSDGEFSHGHVGSAQAQDFVVDFCLGRKMIFKDITTRNIIYFTQLFMPKQNKPKWCVTAK